MGPVPASLKPVQPYLNKAEEMKSADPVVSYYCIPSNPLYLSLPPSLFHPPFLTDLPLPFLPYHRPTLFSILVSYSRHNLGNSIRNLPRPQRHRLKTLPSLPPRHARKDKIIPLLHRRDYRRRSRKSVHGELRRQYFCRGR